MRAEAVLPGSWTPSRGGWYNAPCCVGSITLSRERFQVSCPSRLTVKGLPIPPACPTALQLLHQQGAGRWAQKTSLQVLGGAGDVKGLPFHLYQGAGQNGPRQQARFGGGEGHLLFEVANGVLVGIGEEVENVVFDVILLQVVHQVSPVALWGRGEGLPGGPERRE